MSRVELPPLPQKASIVPPHSRHFVGFVRAYTESQMREYGIACAKAALEAAARQCLALNRLTNDGGHYESGFADGAFMCAADIRALAVGSGGAK